MMMRAILVVVDLWTLLTCECVYGSSQMLHISKIMLTTHSNYAIIDSLSSGNPSNNASVKLIIICYANICWGGDFWTTFDST